MTKVHIEHLPKERDLINKAALGRAVGQALPVVSCGLHIVEPCLGSSVGRFLLQAERYSDESERER